MFKVVIADIRTASVIFRKVVSSVNLPSEEGELSILDFHQPIISYLRKGVIEIDKKEVLPVKEGIAKMGKNELHILVERSVEKK